jgi:Heavy metal binding domain
VTQPKVPEAPGGVQPIKATGRRSLVLAFRLTLLVVAAAALVAAIVVGSRDPKTPSRAHYLCPMHAEVTSAARGTCPICGMDLEPMSEGPIPVAARGSTYETYDTVRRRAYGPDTPAPAWVLDDGTVVAILYTDELASRTPDERATFSPSSDDSPIAVHRTAEAPEPWDRSTLRVRFHSDALAPAPRPGEVGWLRRAMRTPEPPVIPFGAVLEDSGGSYVLAMSTDGRTVARRSVELGRVFGGVAAVLSGLRPSERVLITNAFFLDAERRLRRESAIAVTPR